MNFLTKMQLLKYSYNFEKEYIKKILVNIFAVIILLVGVALIVSNLFIWKNLTFYYISFFVFAFGVFIIMTNDKIISKNHMYKKDADVEKLFDLDTSGIYGDYAIKSWKKNYFIYSPVVNNLIEKKENPVLILNKKFELNKNLKKIAPFVLNEFSKVKNTRIFENKLRLVDDITVGSLIENTDIRLQQTDYFSGLCSNEVCGWDIFYKGDNREIFQGKSVIANRNLIINLIDSPCANIIEINSLLLTADGKLLIKKQSNSYAYNFEQFIPTVSKSINMKQLNKDKTLQALIKDFIDYEIARDSRYSSENFSHFLVGYTRLLNRGGKPEFFAVSKTHLSSDEIIASNKEFFPLLDLGLMVKSKSELNKMLGHILKQDSYYNFSFQLYFLVYLMKKQLNTNPDFVRFLSIF